ncbi:hypothetical protein F9C07_9987 [Aspergillus flavus]|uniref:Uncharacterized protein n=3 Tax=Aspergillus subgen. Circumdati TaxID=2720871 RepID=A0A7U2QRC6_ASPFN|nr:hypothetical protein F9C07_9987 [Aspergillus flavus]GMG30874.1 unnamed protein product [Aspergillus oryzae]GMG50848.1 unnamed protein product [Aspergillus oryzae var. brunneus]
MPIFRHLRSRLSSSSSPATETRSVETHTYYPTDGELVTGSTTRKPHIPNAAQPTKEPQARLEPVSSSSSQEPSFYWQNIDPPAPSHSYQRLSSYNNRLSRRSSKWRPMMLPNSNTVAMNSALPGYNSVSGSVVVDCNGLPYFLSPQEEQERNSKLQRAVQERMMGLRRETEFAWSQPCHGATLPRYSPPKDTQLRSYTK